MDLKDFDPKKSFRYTAQIESIKILVDGKKDIELTTTRVESFKISKSYDELYYPLFQLNLSLSAAHVFYIIENKDKIKFHVRVTSVKKTFNDEFIKKEDIINDILTTYIEEETPNVDKNLIDSVHNGSAFIGEECLNDFGSHMELYLFRDKDLNAGKTNVNYVFQNINITDILAFLLSTSGSKKVLMSPVENGTSYPEILLPPFTIIGCFKYIEAQYGIYSTYATIFYDFDVVYFLSKKLPCTAFRREEQKRVTINISKDDKSDTFFPGIFEQDKQPIINVTKGAFQMTNASLTKDQIAGTDVLMIDNDGNSTEIKPNVSVNGNNKNKQIVVNNYSNPYTSKCEDYKINETSDNLTLNLTDCPVNLFTPNKEYSIVFQDQKLNTAYKGLYRLSNIAHSFTKQGEYFTNSSVLSLYRYNK